MPRRLIPLLLTFPLAVFAQLGGGIGYPGGVIIPGTTYPGGQYPTGGRCPGGQIPTNGVCPGTTYPGQVPIGGGSSTGVPGAYQQIAGNIREIISRSLTVETDDSRIIRMQIAPNARLYTQYGTGRISDFSTGDYVNVEAQRDLNNYYVADMLTLVRQATPQEKAAASRPLNQSMHGGDTEETAKKDKKSKSKDDSKTSPDTAKADDSSSDDDGRPRLKRADSSSSASSGSSSQTPTQVASAAPMPDDPGPPKMRRGAAPRDQAASDAGLPPRPTVRAEEVDGVTQVPTMASASLPMPSGVSATNDPVIDKARETAFEFTETLPDYIVKQYTTRYQSDAATRGKTQWQVLDMVTADVVAENGKESYRNLMVNGKPTKDVEKSGSWSEGEFASTLQAILSPASDALFTNKRSTTIVNRSAWRYDYSIEQPRSSWTVTAGGSRYRPAYGGAIWIDKETSRVLRIEMDARNIPKEFPLDHVESEVDYDFVLIGARKYLLPTHSESLSCNRGTTECSRNAIDFRNYRKYGADSNITFGGETQ